MYAEDIQLLGVGDARMGGAVVGPAVEKPGCPGRITGGWVTDTTAWATVAVVSGVAPSELTDGTAVFRSSPAPLACA